MQPHLQCAEQQVSRPNLTKYCACHAEKLTYLVFITYETSFTVRGAIGITIQPHDILGLPRKISDKTFENRWNVISNEETIREWSDHDPSMRTQTATRLASEVTFSGPQKHFLL